jgi:hypothetical protein
MSDGSCLTFFHAFDAFDASHRSKLFCRFIHRSGVVSKARDRRKAISGVTEPLSLVIFESVFLETPSIVDISVIVIIIRGQN